MGQVLHGSAKTTHAIRAARITKSIGTRDSHASWDWDRASLRTVLKDGLLPTTLGRAAD